MLTFSSQNYLFISCFQTLLASVSPAMCATTPWLRRIRRVVVVTGERAPVKLRLQFPDICFITGVAQKLPTLLQAGANTASDVIVLSGPPTTLEVGY